MAVLCRLWGSSHMPAIGDVIGVNQVKSNQKLHSTRRSVYRYSPRNLWLDINWQIELPAQGRQIITAPALKPPFHHALYPLFFQVAPIHPTTQHHLQSMNTYSNGHAVSLPIQASTALLTNHEPAGPCADRRGRGLLAASHFSVREGAELA